ncbi:MAG TPA: hypothetical protein VKX16_16920, partial [Chloroflexota bacterium]|nr:hypothetical protein [Chloroflexota bacterium]
FLGNLARGRRYRLLARVHYTPTFLGLRFPIDASPHDWRYPSHEILVYQRATAVSAPTAAVCYPSVAAVDAQPPSSPHG